MKRGTPEHPKMKRLCSILCKPNYVGVGILEAMWHLVARYTPDGAIGKLANSEIARAIDWRGDPNNLINALVASGWLETCSCHRLYVHDWKDHADQTVARVLANRKLEFVTSHASIVLAPCYDDASLPKPLSLALPKPIIPTDSETESAEQFLTPPPNGPRPARKRAPVNPDQKVWWDEFWELFWKKDAPDDAERVFRQRVKALDVWLQVRSAVISQTSEQMDRESSKFRTCAVKWLKGGNWKNRPAPESRSQDFYGQP